MFDAIVGLRIIGGQKSLNGGTLRYEELPPHEHSHTITS